MGAPLGAQGLHDTDVPQAKQSKRPQSSPRFSRVCSVESFPPSGAIWERCPAGEECRKIQTTLGQAKPRAPASQPGPLGPVSNAHAPGTATPGQAGGQRPPSMPRPSADSVSPKAWVASSEQQTWGTCFDTDIQERRESERNPEKAIFQGSGSQLFLDGMLEE